MEDPTQWLDDLNVFVDDESLSETAAQLEPSALYLGSKPAAGAWLGAIGIAAGAFSGATLSSDVRSSTVIFAGYLACAALLFRGLRPATVRLLGEAIVWPARTSFFWSCVLVWSAAIGGGLDRAWVGYALSGGMGLFIGLLHGSLTPSYVKREDAWLLTSLGCAPASALLATYIHRNVFLGSGSLVPMATVGALAGGLFTVVTSALLVRVWNDSHGLGQMAKLFLHNDNFVPKALAYLDRALAFSPDDVELLNMRGIAWSRMDEPERAAADWKRVAELRPKTAESQMNLGVDFVRQGALDAAIAAFEGALALDPDGPMIHSNLGAALQKRGNLDRAIQHYTRAISLKPDYANAYSNRAYAHLRRGDFVEAVKDCDRALTLDPRLAMACVNRGHALGALGCPEEAAESFSEALDMDSSPAVRQEALEGMEALRAQAQGGGEPA